MPVLVLAIDQVTGDEREVLGDHLRYRLKRMEASARWRNWPSFHLARQRAYDLLARNRARTERATSLTAE